MKKRFMFLLVLMVAATLAMWFPRQVSAASQAELKDNGDGTVTMVYDNTYTVRLKLVVQKDGGKQYKYDIPKGKVELFIPLTQGNGTYKLMLCRNTSGSKYSVMQTKSISLSLSDEKAAYLTSNYIISWEATNDAIKKAQSLTKKSKTQAQKLDAIYKYVVQNYSYDFDKAKQLTSTTTEMAYIPDIDEVYDDETGICYDISVLVAAMLRSVDIPTEVVTGYTPNATTYHAWNNVFYEKQSKWKVIDATYDMQMNKAKKKYSMFKDAKDYSDIVYVY